MATPQRKQSPQPKQSPKPIVITPAITYAREHARPADSFVGSSKLAAYEMMGKLGEGTFGEVHRARSKKTGAIVALKKILMHNEKDGFPITALREIKLLKLLNHKNVLKLEEMAVEKYQKSGGGKERFFMYMVTPYMDHDLSGLLENPKITFTEPQIKCYMLQLLEGVRYLHANHILHRDMKAANLLINNKGILQIADFGLARHYDGEVPVEHRGGGEGRRDYTVLVVTRWYRPPELLLQLRKYTTAIDIWGVGCVFGEMLVGKPILAGESDHHQLKIICELVGTPTDDSMPGWRQLPGAEGLNLVPRSSSIPQRFREYGSGAISLLGELLKLDWRKRSNAIDALNHPYFRTAPLPAKPGDLPTFEESHELDRRKFRGQKAAPPPAPKGGTVGMGAQGGWAGDQMSNGNGYSNNRNHSGGPRHPPPPPHGAPPPRNGIPHPSIETSHKPAWVNRGDRRDVPDTRLPPRPPPADYSSHGPRGGERPDGYRSRSRDLDTRERGPPRSRGGVPNVDTYIPSYGADGPPRRDERPREDRPRERRRDDRDDRRHDRDRNGRTRSRSRSPRRDADRERVREREPLDSGRDRERDVYRR